MDTRKIGKEIVTIPPVIVRDFLFTVEKDRSFSLDKIKINVEFYSLSDGLRSDNMAETVRNYIQNRNHKAVYY